MNPSSTALPKMSSESENEISLCDRESKRQKTCTLVDVRVKEWNETRIISVDQGDFTIIERLRSCSYDHQFGVDNHNRIDWLACEFRGDNDIDRQLFEQFAKLSALNHLGLSVEGFESVYPANPSSLIIPSSIALLQNLETLDISENGLISLPEEIGKLVNLERLDVNNNYLSSFTFLRNMEKLKTLNMSYLELDDIPKECLNLTSLSELTLTGNDLEHLPEEIGNLVNLEELTVDYNPIVSLPASIGNLKKLKKLSMEHVPIAEFPNEFGNLSSLSDLNLRENTVLEHIPKVFGKLTSLKSLNLEMNYELFSVSSWIKDFKQLEYLSLQNTQIQDLPIELWEMTSLKGLYLRDNYLVDIPKQIGNLMSLQSVSLANTSITSLPTSIGNLKHLNWLSLSKNKISQLPSSIGSLKQLKTLYITDTEIKEFPTEFWDLSGLEILEARNTSLLIPPSIERLQNLQRVHFSIKGKLPKEFGNLTSLKYLSFSGGNTEFLPFSVANLQQLETLSLTGLTRSIDIRQLGFIRKLPNLNYLCIVSDAFDPQDLTLQEDRIELLLDLVQGTPSLQRMDFELMEKLPNLRYFLGCNCFQGATSALFSNTEIPLTKLWPRMLLNAKHTFGSHKSKIESHDAVYKLLTEGTESFVQVLLERSCNSRDIGNGSDTESN